MDRSGRIDAITKEKFYFPATWQSIGSVAPEIGELSAGQILCGDGGRKGLLDMCREEVRRMLVNVEER
jgi:hypothetical protein